MDGLGNERRRHQRITVDAVAQIFSGSAMWTTAVRDLSLRGAQLQRPDGWDGLVGQRFRLNVRVAGSLSIGMAVALVRETDDTLGFVCQRIDLDSLIRLKRLVELNLGNPDRLKRELSDLGLPA